jgi:LruC domain-containing protein
VHFRFLNTNGNLGDPEAFYDFSGGFEDVALVTNADASVLNTLQPGLTGAPLVVATETLCTVCSHVYYPSSTDYYLAAYEDQYPNTGDYYFNDLLVAYRVSYGLDADGRVKTIDGEGYLLARGGSYNLDWYLNIPVPRNTTGTGELKIYAPNQTTPMTGYPQNFQVNSSLNLKVFNNLRSLYVNPAVAQVNTIWNAGYVPGHKFKFSVTLDISVLPNQIAAAPYDPYVFIQSTGYEVHLPGKTALLPNSLNVARKKTTFKDSNNFPFALVLPTDWAWANEYVNITSTYPQFVSFVNSGNQSNLEWYRNGVQSGLTKFSNRWQW